MHWLVPWALSRINADCMALVGVRDQGARSASWSLGILRPQWGPPWEETSSFTPSVSVSWLHSQHPEAPCSLLFRECLNSCSVSSLFCWQWKEIAEPGLPMVGVSCYGHSCLVIRVSSQGCSASQSYSEVQRYSSEHLGCSRLLYHR